MAETYLIGGGGGLLAERACHIVSQGDVKLASKGIAQEGMFYIQALTLPVFLGMPAGPSSSKERHLGLCAEVLLQSPFLHLDLP